MLAYLFCCTTEGTTSKTSLAELFIPPVPSVWGYMRAPFVCIYPSSEESWLLKRDCCDVLESWIEIIAELTLIFLTILTFI